MFLSVKSLTHAAFVCCCRLRFLPLEVGSPCANAGGGCVLPEHEHTDTDPVCLYLTMECVKSADIWGRRDRRPSADADAVGEAVPPIVRRACELFASLFGERRHILTSSLQKLA